MSYTRCSFKSVVDAVLDLAGLESSTTAFAQKDTIGRNINRHLKEWAWAGWHWPELVKTELRHYRLDYASGTAYAAPTTTAASEVYYPPTRQYYQALKATTGNAPATLSGGTYSTNDAYWAIAGGPYTGPDWADATAYVVADIVRNPANGRFYQCHTAHTSSGSLDGTKFGILTDFDPYISRTQTGQTEIGDFLGLFLDNPLQRQQPRRIAGMADSLGMHVTNSPVGRWGLGMMADFLVPHEVWVRFRLPCPELRGSTFDATATYTASVDTVYFEGTTTDLEGDFWLCAVNTTAGQSPQTTAASWTRKEFPAWLRNPVAIRAYADWLVADGQGDKAAEQRANADEALYQAQLQQGAQQGQVLHWRKSA